MNGVKTYLGRDKEVALKRSSELVAAAAQRRRSLTYFAIRDFLQRRMKITPSADRCGIQGVRGIVINGAIVVPCGFEHVNSLPETVGAVLLSRQHVDPSGTTKPVIVCYVEDGQTAAIELARGLGILFLSPQEVVETFGANVKRPTASSSTSLRMSPERKHTGAAASSR